MFGRKKVYTPENLPVFFENTSGWVTPRPDGDVIACLMPEDRTIQAPWGPLEGEDGVHWHQVLSMKSYAGDDIPDQYPNI